MNSTPIRLVAFDLDGTLMDAGENVVHPPVRHAIQLALKKGVTITLATGRPFLFTRPVAVELGLDAPLICYQGGVIQQMDGRMLRNISFSPSVLESPVALARRRGWQCYVEADGVLFVDAGADYDQALFDIHSGPSRPIPDLIGVEPPPNQLGVYLPTGVTPAHVAELQAAFGSAATVMRSHAHFINAIPAGVSKGAAVAWLAERLGVPRSAVMAVGDSDNDASMVGWAGLGVAMGDARPSVVEKADWIAPTLQEHGAAAALERFVLPTRL
jgi:Cof subfamily protein (haloacid dehalogenase superfamily)